MTLENFKSYAGEQHIGPFHKVCRRSPDSLQQAAPGPAEAVHCMPFRFACCTAVALHNITTLSIKQAAALLLASHCDVPASCSSPSALLSCLELGHQCTMSTRPLSLPFLGHAVYLGAFVRESASCEGVGFLTAAHYLLTAGPAGPRPLNSAAPTAHAWSVTFCLPCLLPYQARSLDTRQPTTLQPCSQASPPPPVQHPHLAVLLLCGGPQRLWQVQRH